ncbi:unnamed protein product, partial [Prunus brigantina]
MPRLAMSSSASWTPTPATTRSSCIIPIAYGIHYRQRTLLLQPTYQRLVNQIFAELIGTSMEVYVDDMLVKSRTADDHLRNLSLMFGKLKQYNMCLNPSKCSFGVASGKFLGFMISQRGIEANPEKIRVLIDMRVPKTKKEVQSLKGRVTALAYFISKATDRCAPFFKALKWNKRQVDWTSECDRAFED